MIIKYLYTSFIFFIFCLFIVGCAPHAKVPITKPADINLSKYKKIVISRLDGNLGDQFGDLLTSKLFEANTYEVLDRDNLDRVMAEHRFNLSGMVDSSTAVKMGKFLGASALVSGNVNYNYKILTSASEGYRDKHGNYHRSYHKEGTATVVANLRVIDLETGKILAVKSITEKESDTTSDNNGYPPDPDRDRVVSLAADRVLNQFIKMIAPHVEYVSIYFETTNESGPGVTYARNGLWKEALQQFKTAKDINPSDPSNWYNLGIAYQFNYLFREAETAFAECNKITPSDTCIRALSDVKLMEMEQEKLSEQME